MPSLHNETVQCNESEVLGVKQAKVIYDSFYFQDLLNVVRPTGLISPDQILDAIKAKNESRDMDLQYRGYLSKLAHLDVVIACRMWYRVCLCQSVHTIPVSTYIHASIFCLVLLFAALHSAQS